MVEINSLGVSAASVATFCWFLIQVEAVKLICWCWEHDESMEVLLGYDFNYYHLHQWLEKSEASIQPSSTGGRKLCPGPALLPVINSNTTEYCASEYCTQPSIAQLSIAHNRVLHIWVFHTTKYCTRLRIALTSIAHNWVFHRQTLHTAEYCIDKYCTQLSITQLSITHSIVLANITHNHVLHTASWALMNITHNQVLHWVLSTVQTNIAHNQVLHTVEHCADKYYTQLSIAHSCGTELFFAHSCNAWMKIA